MEGRVFGFKHFWILFIAHQISEKKFNVKIILLKEQ